MAIFGNTAVAGNVSPFIPAQGQNPAVQKKPSPKVWLNVGYIHEATDDAGVVTSTFIGLPLGIGIDTMEKKSAGKSELLQAKNAFLDKWQGVAATLQPGEERLIPCEGGLVLQLRRVADHEEATAENNSMIASLGKLNF